MDTLLERLRVQQEWFSEGHGALHKEAADEIERLRAIINKADYFLTQGAPILALEVLQE